MGLTRTFLGNEALLGSLFNSLVAGGGAFLAFLAIFLAYPQGMGGGDVKFVGVMGLLLGIQGAAVGLWSAIVSGGLTAIALIVLRKRGRKDAIPFGPFLAFGAIIGLLWGNDVMSGYESLVDWIAG